MDCKECNAPAMPSGFCEECETRIKSAISELDELEERNNQTKQPGVGERE